MKTLLLAAIGCALLALVLQHAVDYMRRRRRAKLAALHHARCRAAIDAGGQHREQKIPASALHRARVSVIYTELDHGTIIEIRPPVPPVNKSQPPKNRYK